MIDEKEQAWLQLKQIELWLKCRSMAAEYLPIDTDLDAEADKLYARAKQATTGERG